MVLTIRFCLLFVFIVVAGVLNLFGQSSGLQKGLATYYGDKFQGRKTANGELFCQTRLTAAHRTLPFNTWVKVTNLKNLRAVVVRINDRGPFVRGRIIDLSKRAAFEIGLLQDGNAKVQVEVVDHPQAEEQLLKYAPALAPHQLFRIPPVKATPSF